jgi:preprotein translocase subunit SecD
MKINRKYENLLFSIFMALCMSFFMSLILSLINIGAVEGFILIWSKSWIISFIIALPVTILIPKFIRYCMQNAIKFHE